VIEVNEILREAGFTSAAEVRALVAQTVAPAKEAVRQRRTVFVLTPDDDAGMGLPVRPIRANERDGQVASFAQWPDAPVAALALISAHATTRSPWNGMADSFAALDDFPQLHLQHG
jgi:hypothetical protein